jgi:ribonuclease P/MRP protein subunit RPP1
VALEPGDYPALAERGLKPTVLSRLTIHMTTNDFMIAYNKSAVAKQYDILAINCPSSPALTALLKSSFRFDLLSFCPDQVVAGVRWTRKLYSECVERHVHLELSYGPMVRSSVDRRRVISQSHTYRAVGRSRYFQIQKYQNTAAGISKYQTPRCRAVLVTSGALSPLELRAPADVANLGFLLGLKQAEGVAAVERAGGAVHRAGLGRRLGPFRVRVEVLGEENLHLVPAPADIGDGNDGEKSLPAAVNMEP